MFRENGVDREARDDSTSRTNFSKLMTRLEARVGNIGRVPADFLGSIEEAAFSRKVIEFLNKVRSL